MIRSAKIRALAAALSCLSLTTLVGCDHFFGHDEQVQDPLVVQEQGLSCVRAFGPDLVAFLDGDDRDPVRMVDCVSGALKKFADNTRGGSPDGWTRGELSSFFETYFKEEAKSEVLSQAPSKSKTETAATTSSDSHKNSVEPFSGDWVSQARRRAIVTELFRWKAALIGGGDTTLSRDEVSRILKLLTNARPALADLRGHGAWLGFKSSNRSVDPGSESSFDISDLSRVTDAIRTLAGLLAAEFSKNTATREPMNFQTLAGSLERAGLKSLDSKERKQLVQSMKVVVLAGNADQIAGDEWSELVAQSCELWIAALRFKYGILENPRAFNRDLSIVESTSFDLTRALRRMVQRHSGRIDNDDLRGMITQLGANKLLPSSIQAKSLNEALETIFGKLLAGNSLAQKNELRKGLTIKHLDRLDEVVRDWSEGQRVAIQISGASGLATISQAKVAMSEIAAESKDPEKEIVRLQMSELVLRGRPLVRDSAGRLLILPIQHLTGYKLTDLESLNLSRTLMSATMRGYSYESARSGAMPQITENEIQEMFMDLKGLGRDLGIVDVRSLNSGVRTFMESNIFLSVSDGNQFISLHEMVEWFSTVISAGLSADQVHEDLIADKVGSPRCRTSPMDVFARYRVKAQCFRENVIPILKNRMSHLPNFIKALGQAERERQLGPFIEALELAGRPLGVSDLPVESSELRVISPIVHYVEALFARFDADGSGVLEDAEVWSAYPLIQPFIRKLAVDDKGQPRELSPDLERAVFSWLIMKGKAPESTIGGIIAIKGHQWSMWAVDERATFSGIVNILASFNKVGRDKKNKDVINYYLENRKMWEQAITRGDKGALDLTRDLFQCAGEADADLTRLLQARRADIFAIDQNLDDDDQAVEFLKRFKSMIQADPQLQLMCSAF